MSGRPLAKCYFLTHSRLLWALHRLPPVMLHFDHNASGVSSNAIPKTHQKMQNFPSRSHFSLPSTQLTIVYRHLEGLVDWGGASVEILEAVGTQEEGIGNSVGGLPEGETAS